MTLVTPILDIQTHLCAPTVERRELGSRHHSGTNLDLTIVYVEIQKYCRQTRLHIYSVFISFSPSTSTNCDQFIQGSKGCLTFILAVSFYGLTKKNFLK